MEHPQYIVLITLSNFPASINRNTRKCPKITQPKLNAPIAAKPPPSHSNLQPANRSIAKNVYLNTEHLEEILATGWIQGLRSQPPKKTLGLDEEKTGINKRLIANGLARKLPLSHFLVTQPRRLRSVALQIPQVPWFCTCKRFSRRNQV